MIPQFDDNGNLPPGIHAATLSEIKKRFAYNSGRLKLFDGLKSVVEILEECSCSELYLNGSFITDNVYPNDYDLCWEPAGVKPTAELKELLTDLEISKQKYLGDVCVRFPQPPFYFDHVIEWQQDRDGNTKGIIKLLIGSSHD